MQRGYKLITKGRFYIERQKGSHVFLKHRDGKATVVPLDSAETIGPGVL